jgi:hypothetical protein
MQAYADLRTDDEAGQRKRPQEGKPNTLAANDFTPTFSHHFIFSPTEVFVWADDFVMITYVRLP